MNNKSRTIGPTFFAPQDLTCLNHNSDKSPSVYHWPIGQPIAIYERVHGKKELLIGAGVASFEDYCCASRLVYSHIGL